MAPPRSRLRTRSCRAFVLLAACANSHESIVLQIGSVEMVEAVRA